MQNQQQQGNFTDSNQIPNQQNHGGHELLDTHEAISSLVGGMEQYMLYEQHIQDQKLKSMSQRHRSFMAQLYNSMVDTLKTGKDPAVKTQTYMMEEENDILYGMQASAPKTPAQSANEINDECVSSFMLGICKACASSFTMTACEVGNPVLRRMFADSVPNMVEMAYELFLYQNKNQYYQVPKLQPQDMQILMNSFAPVQGTMPH